MGWSTRFQNNDPSYLEPRISNAETSLAQKTPLFTITNHMYVFDPKYGAVGDGVTDDTTAIQNAINDAPNYATLHFDGSKTYLIKKSLTLNKPLKFDFHGCTLLLNNSSSPNNRILTVAPTFSLSQTWTQAITQGTTVLTPIASTTGYNVGDTVAVQLGTDPNDSTQPHWVKICRVTAVTSTSITIDCPVGYAINAGTRNNNIQKIALPIDTLTIENVTVDYVNGSVPDRLFDVEWSKNVTFKNIKAKKTTILFLLMDCENVVIENVDATLTYNNTADSARLLGTWHSRNISMKNIIVYTAYATSLVMTESFNDGIYADGFKIYSTNNTVNYVVFHFAGGSTNNHFKNVEFNCTANPNLFDFVQGSTGTFENVNIKALVKSIDTAKLRGRLSYNGVDYEQTTIYRKQITLGASLTAFNVNLPQGIYKQVKLYVSSLTGLTKAYLFNSNNQGFDTAPSLVAGSTVIPGNYERLGTDYAFNDPTYPAKKLQFYTDGTANNITFAIFIEYYPINNDVAQYPFS
jgi:hypothetical protein